MEPHDYRMYYVNIDLRHQYGISAAESQTFLRAKRPQRRRARRNGCFRRLRNLGFGGFKGLMWFKQNLFFSSSREKAKEESAACGQWSAVSKDGRHVLLTACVMCSVYCLMQIFTVFFFISWCLGVSVYVSINLYWHFDALYIFILFSSVYLLLYQVYDIYV